MRSLPIDIGIIHFIGIGGIGMSGIAEILHNLGYKVQGSDISENQNVIRLRKLGIKVSVGQASENLGLAAIAVISTAIQKDNVELQFARKKQIPVVHRSEMLAELMRLKWSIACAGTHGKTTTTSLVASMLDAAGLDPTVINGGILNSYGTNARLGDGEWMVVEADESDGSFNNLPATIAVVTNIDPEHLDFHGNFENLKNAFQSFLKNIPFYGFAVVCIDHPVVQELVQKIHDRRIITYGFDKKSDVRVSNIAATDDGSCFDVSVRGRNKFPNEYIKRLQLPMFGEHNVLNALAAIAISLEMGMDEDLIRSGLREFKGVKRRFTKTGVSNGITVIDDYGHHPVEIQAALNAARLACKSGKVIAVFQPHRYTRLRDLFDEFCNCFNEADVVFVSDVYAAGEMAIEKYDRDHLVQGIKSRHNCKVFPLKSSRELPAQIAANAAPGDLVICLGAGNITTWANSLPNNLEEFLAPFGSHSSQESKTGPNQLRNNQSDENCKVEADFIKTGDKIL